ncbi:HAD-IA family hydrolase [Photobacterium leiognathi]|uniref:HAD-IA family hydrolase n=1 Tax=Photobacterium leiognathi TaxID=553611 RepID=UPI00076A7706|nr:HAD-IA family hydrolase [Photobacterium leiognathi]
MMSSIANKIRQIIYKNNTSEFNIKSELNFEDVVFFNKKDLPLFDESYYLTINKDVKDSGLNAIEHYLNYGWREGRWPSEHFDPTYYLNLYPDVKNANIEPLEHYLKYGWKEGRNPSNVFNTQYYLDENQDVSNAGVNPLIHWVDHGQYEGRKCNIKYINSDLETNNHSSIIFVSHEASETGAPAVLLSLMDWLKNNTNINFSIVVGASGPWNDKFEKIAPTFFFDQPHTEEDIRRFCGNHVQSIYVNTIAAASYAKALEFLHAEYITHVHEMENVFKIFENEVGILKEICQKYIAVSPGSVDSLNKRFRNIQLEYLKPFINKYAQVETTNHPCPSKKIVFGCGAVEKRKGFDLFCGVAKTLKAKGISNVEMHWVGSDVSKDLNALETIQQFDVADIVKFLGPKANPRDYFKHGSLFLLTSREDPYPLVCMEAAELELPVICFDDKAGGMHTFVENDAGIVVPYLNVEKMSEAVISIISDKDKARCMGEMAKKKVTERHYVDVIAPQILALLPDVACIEADNELERYKALIKNAEIISFDIFDTLITRELSSPEIVFDIAEHLHTKNESGILSLFEERMKTAGKVLGSYQGKVDDICINEIYENMPLYRDSSIEKKAEIDICITHPIGKELYNYARELDKKIYITSDMYLDRNTIEKILNKNGFDYWDEFFLSSECGKKKDTGKLFSELLSVANKSKNSGREILHIGDNWTGDIKFARKAGINAVRFSPLYESNANLITIPFEHREELSQNGRIWDSFSTQSTRLWANENPELANDFYTKLGFELTGPLASMMAIHSKKLADNEGIQKIVFMARDGRVIKKAFDTLYKSEIDKGIYESKYLHLSRATVIPATFEENLSSNDLYFLIEGLHLAEKPISYFLNKANLDCKDASIRNKVCAFFDSIDYIPNWNDFSALSAMLESLSSEIYTAHKSHRHGLELYLKENDLLDINKFMIVDVGWLLNIQSRLERFILRLGSETKITGSYVGTRERINKNLKHTSLLYNFGEPSIYSNFLEDNVTLFEVLFSSPEPSASSIKSNNDKAELSLKPLGIPLPKEYIVAQKLQMGAEAYFEKLAKAQESYFPHIISIDYFFKIFKSLVNSDKHIVKAELSNFEVRLGGHHEFIAYQSLVKNDSFTDYKIKSINEYFEPILFNIEDPIQKIVFVTSAGLANGSTRYRSLNMAEYFKIKGWQSTVIHAATSVEKVELLISQADKIIFQRCFEQQGNVGEFLKLARNLGVECIGEMDDLVFPEHISSIGSVKGGEWNIEEAMFVAKSYESFLLQMDSCIVSTPALKEYIESTYNLKCTVYKNRINSSKVREALHKQGPIKLIYASGTYSHKEDFELIEQPLFDFLSNNRDVKLSILGATQSSERILALPNVSSYPLLPYDAMLNFISKHDVMLVPLVNDIFNNAKSNVKFIESSAVGVPVMASSVREFNTSIKHNINGYLFNDQESFNIQLNSLKKNNIQKICNELKNIKN